MTETGRREFRHLLRSHNLDLAALGCPLRRGLDVADRSRDRRFEVGEVDRLGQEIERAAIHGGADVGHVAVGRYDHRRQILFAGLQFLQQ